MKKILSIILIFVLAIPLVSCGRARSDARAQRYEGSAAQMRVNERRRLKNNEGAEEGAAAQEGEKITLRLAEVHEAGYPTTLADEKFAELVAEKTDGRITVEVYTDGKLGDESSAIEQMQNGTLDFARISLSPMAEYEPSFNVFLMPYLYNDAEHMWKVLNSDLGQNMLENISSANLVGLAWYDGGSRCFFANRDIKTLDDFKGLRVRMQNNSLMFGLAKALGCEPVSMDMGDINTSIEQGVLDGAENNIPTYESFGHVNFAPYYILDNHSRIPEILAGSQQTFNKLSADDQKIIKECAKQSQEYQIQQWNASEEKSEEIIKSQGVKLVELSEDTMNDMRQVCQPLYDEFAGDYNDIIEEIRAMAD